MRCYLPIQQHIMMTLSKLTGIFHRKIKIIIATITINIILVFNT